MKARGLWCMFILLLVCGCGRAVEKPTYSGPSLSKIPPLETEYRIRAGDHLSLKLFYNPELNQEVTVRPDGRISLLLLREAMAEGQTPEQLRSALVEGYARFVQKAEVTVVVTSFAGQRVYVGGEVVAAGPRELIGPISVLQVILASGGFRDTARTNEVIVIRRDAHNKPSTIAVDLAKVMKGEDMSQDIQVKPFDIVLVPRSNIANVNVWVNQYIRGTVSIPREFLYYYQFYNDVSSGNPSSNF